PEPEPGTWFHGSGANDLSADTITSEGGNIEGLFGAGVYTTNAPDISSGYAKARGKRTGTPSVYKLSDVAIDGNVLDMEKPATQDVVDAMIKGAGWEEGIADAIRS